MSSPLSPLLVDSMTIGTSPYARNCWAKAGAFALRRSADAIIFKIEVKYEYLRISKVANCALQIFLEIFNLLKGARITVIPSFLSPEVKNVLLEACHLLFI
jgi:hypothetical protein